MKLSEWYPQLTPHTFETVLIPMNLPTAKQNQVIQSTLDQWGKVFVRLDELSPKHFAPCTTLSQVWQCLKVPRTEQVLRFTQYLCLRKWVDFSELLELRCFVFDRKVTALCSNDAQEDSKSLPGFVVCNPHDVKLAAINFLAPILPSLHANCTVDIAVTKNLEFKVIEVNSSVDDFSGPGLFDLDNPSDLWQLHRGSDNPRFRYFIDNFYTKEEC